MLDLQNYEKELIKMTILKMMIIKAIMHMHIIT